MVAANFFLFAFFIPYHFLLDDLFFLDFLVSLRFFDFLGFCPERRAFFSDKEEEEESESELELSFPEEVAVEPDRRDEGWEWEESWAVADSFEGRRDPDVNSDIR